MSDRYIPKIGDEGFEWRPEFYDIWFKRGKVIAETDKQIVFLKTNGEIGTVSKKCSFRPIPTKADVEREQLNKIINDNVSWVDVVNEIQKAGFTIPKKVKRSELNAFLDKWYGEWLDDNDMAADELCELLGDLVEDEAND